jgi:hypothetical protein
MAPPKKSSERRRTPPRVTTLTSLGTFGASNTTRMEKNGKKLTENDQKMVDTVKVPMDVAPLLATTSIIAKGPTSPMISGEPVHESHRVNEEGIAENEWKLMTNKKKADKTMGSMEVDLEPELGVGRYVHTISFHKLMALMPASPNVPTIIQPILVSLMKHGETHLSPLNPKVNSGSIKTAEDIKNQPGEIFKKYVGATATKTTLRVYVKVQTDLEYGELKRSMMEPLQEQSWYMYERALDPSKKPIVIGFFIRKDHSIFNKEGFKEQIKGKIGSEIPFEIEEMKNFRVHDNGKEIGITKALVIQTSHEHMTALEEQLLQAFPFATTNQGCVFVSQCRWTKLGEHNMKALINLHHEYMSTIRRIQVFGVKIIDVPCIVQSGTVKSIRQWLLANPNVLEVDHRGSHVNILGSTKNQDALLMLKLNLIDTLRALVKVEMQGEVLEEQSQIWSSKAPSPVAVEFCQNVTAQFNQAGGDGEAPGEQVCTPYPTQVHGRRSNKKIRLGFTTIKDSASMNYAKAVKGNNSTHSKHDGNSPQKRNTNPESDKKEQEVTPTNKEEAALQDGRMSEDTPSDFDSARTQWKVQQKEMENRITAGQASLKKYMLALADKTEKEQQAQKVRLDSLTEAITEMLKSNTKSAKQQEQYAQYQAEAMREAIHNQQVDQQNHKQEVMKMFCLFQEQLMSLIKKEFPKQKRRDKTEMEDYQPDAGVYCGQVQGESEDKGEGNYLKDSGQDSEECDDDSEDDSNAQWSTAQNAVTKKRKNLASPQTPEREQAKGTTWKPSTHAQDIITCMVDRAKKFE